MGRCTACGERAERRNEGVEAARGRDFIERAGEAGSLASVFGVVVWGEARCLDRAIRYLRTYVTE